MRCNTVLYTCSILLASVDFEIHANRDFFPLSELGTRWEQQKTRLNEECRQKPHYDCKNGDCVTPANARCDGTKQCQDESDEADCPAPGCHLPKQPIGGSFEINSCSGRLCNIAPGRKLPKDSSLTYRCNEGYTLKGNNVSYCHMNTWYLPPTCVKICPVLTSNSIDIVCKYQEKVIPCNSTIIPGTKATLECKYLYIIPPGNDPGYSEITCLEEGGWDHPLFQCILAECGKAVSRGTLMIYNGTLANLGDFPWHVGIYKKKSIANYEQICGGTLVSPDLIVSAAHCFYDDTLNLLTNSSEFAVVAGKFFRPYNLSEPFAQNSLVKKIHIANRYYGLGGNYAQDIALVRLENSFLITKLVMPICMDWEKTHEREHLQSGKSGKVVGWGITASGVSSTILQKINLPYIPYQNCVSAVPQEFRGFLTADKFCAGYLNGPSMCQGDSGGGLCFEFDGLWFLRGIVSTSPVSNDTSCNSHYTAFTNVGNFLGWIRNAYLNVE